MRQRLGLAEIVMKDARIAILDEPTNGLDPQASIELLELIRSLKADGVSILLSSHLLDRVQSVCDRVALFNAGRIALMGTVGELGRQVLGGGFAVEVEAVGGVDVTKRLAALPGVRSVEEPAPGRWRIDLRPRPARRGGGRSGGRRRAAPSALARSAEPGDHLHPLLPESRRCVMRREGSPWQGLGVVTLKELSDHFASARMRVLEWLVVLIALAAVYGAIQQIRDVTAEDPFLFLRLFTTARDPLPSFVSFLSFLVPLMAIGLGFDAVNGEHNRRTLSRILSQPIYRDALLFGKFIAALATLSVSLIALWLLVIGLGLITLGVPPGGEEMARAFIFLLVTIAYAGVWLALAMLLSVVFRSAATAALVTLGIWLFLTLIWPALAPAIAEAVVPPDNQEALVITAQMLARLSPSTLFGECVLALLNPTTRTLGPVYLSQLEGAVMGSPLPLWDSVMVAWPQIVGLIAGTILLFVGGYVAFQRQEVRAWRAPSSATRCEPSLLIPPPLAGEGWSRAVRAGLRRRVGGQFEGEIVRRHRVGHQAIEVVEQRRRRLRRQGSPALEPHQSLCLGLLQQLAHLRARHAEARADVGIGDLARGIAVRPGQGGGA